MLANLKLIKKIFSGSHYLAKLSLCIEKIGRYKYNSVYFIIIS